MIATDLFTEILAKKPLCMCMFLFIYDKGEDHLFLLRSLPFYLCVLTSTYSSLPTQLSPPSLYIIQYCFSQ